MSAVLDRLTAAAGATFGADVTGVRLEASEVQRLELGTGQPVRADSGRLTALTAARCPRDGTAAC